MKWSVCIDGSVISGLYPLYLMTTCPSSLSMCCVLCVLVCSSSFLPLRSKPMGGRRAGDHAHLTWRRSAREVGSSHADVFVPTALRMRGAKAKHAWRQTVALPNGAAGRRYVSWPVAGFRSLSAVVFLLLHRMARSACYSLVQNGRHLKFWTLKGCDDTLTRRRVSETVD